MISAACQVRNVLKEKTRGSSPRATNLRISPRLCESLRAARLRLRHNRDRAQQACWIDADRIDADTGEKARDLRIIGRRLTADADVAVVALRALHGEAEQSSTPDFTAGFSGALAVDANQRRQTRSCHSC